MKRILLILPLFFCLGLLQAQEDVIVPADSVFQGTVMWADGALSPHRHMRNLPDSSFIAEDDVLEVDSSLYIDTVVLNEQMRLMNKEVFHPDPQKSLWLSFVFPGLGQIYNRKYWKLPIVYGIGVGIGYAIGWTNRRYREYMIGYQNINSAHPDPAKWAGLVPEGYPESSASDYMKNEMDQYRRSRDISIVAGVVAYALTIVDAFVDAQLSDFDVSPDLSMKVAPRLQETNDGVAVGCGLKLNF